VQISGILIVFSPFFVFIPQLVLLYQLISRKEWIPKSSWTAGLGLLFFWSFFVGIINTQVFSVLSSLMFLGYFSVSSFIDRNCSTVEQIEELLRYIFLLTLGSALFGLLENMGLISHAPAWWKYLFGFVTLVENEENLFRITGTFGNPNLAASWYAVMILVGYYFYQKSGKQEKPWFFWGILLLVAVLVMTGSRGALIGLLMGLVVYDLLAGNTFQMVIRLLVFVSIFAFLFSFPELFPRGDLLSSTIDLRWAIWENCFNMFLKKPLTGWGIMGIYFADNNVYQYLRVLHAHNMLISLAVMLGLGGILIFVWMEGKLLQNLWLLFRDKCPLVPLLAGVQTVFFGHGIFDFTIMAPQIGLLFIAFSSFISALSCSRDTPEGPSRWYGWNPFQGSEGRNSRVKANDKFD